MNTRLIHCTSPDSKNENSSIHRIALSEEKQDEPRTSGEVPLRLELSVFRAIGPPRVRGYLAILFSLFFVLFWSCDSMADLSLGVLRWDWLPSVWFLVTVDDSENYYD